MRQSTTAVLWGVFTVTAVTTGLGAVGVIRESVTTPAAAPLSQQEVAAELAMAPPVTVVTTPSARPTPSRSTTSSAAPTHTSGPSATHTSSAPPTHSATPTGATSAPPSPLAVTRSLGSHGGSVVATCTSGSVYLKSWSPASSFRVEEVQRGPARDVEVRFDSATQEIKLRVVCVAGVPTGSVETSNSDTSDSESLNSGD